MATKAVATLTNTGPMEWVVTEDGTGTVLVKLFGPERPVLDCAAASLVADHGYPNGGSWQIEARDRVEQIDLSLWTASLMIERRLMENLYVSVRGGVHLGGDLELRDGDARVELASDFDAAAFAAVGLSWKF